MIRNINASIASALENMNATLYIGIFVTVKVAWNFLGREIYFDVTNESFSSDISEVGNVYFAFFSLTICGPLLETYLVQYLFFNYLGGRIANWWIVVLSAMTFAVFHWYNAGYVFYAFGSGLLLSASYALRLRSNPFACTFVIHSVYNFLAFFYNRWH